MSVFISSLHSIALGTSLLFFLKIAAGIFAFLLTASFGKKAWVRELLPQIFLTGGIGVALVGFLFLVTSQPSQFSIGSIFYQSDVYAGYLLLLLFLAAGAAVFFRDASHRLLYGVTAFFLVFSLFLTVSRAAIVIFLVLFFLWSFLVSREKPALGKWMGMLPVCFVAAGALVLVYLHHFHLAPALWKKMESVASLQTATSARLCFWQGGWRLFLRHPWLGSGPDTFGRLFPSVQQHFYWYSKYPHNAYLQMLSEEGIVTAIFFFFLVAYFMACGIEILKRKGKEYPLAVGLMMSLLAGLFHQFFDVDSNFLAWSLLFWGEAGLLVALLEPSPPASSRVLLKVLFGTSALLLFGFQILTALSFHWDLQAESRIASGDDSAAFQKESRAIRAFPVLSSLYDRRAQIELDFSLKTKQKKWLDSAIADWKKALWLDPAQPSYLGELADVFSHIPGGQVAAKRLLRRALVLDPQNYPAYYVRLGTLEFSEGKFSNAEEEYRELLLRYPEDQIQFLPFFRRSSFVMARALAYGGLAQTAFRERRWSEGEKDLRLALGIARSQLQDRDLVKYLERLRPVSSRRPGS